ncbi:hypothetical protein Leryth_009392 [Lithospermum erythrorhizon]|nr:hypothetical protein Leryth_009392 [Lithospermum erythrorhizon]
MKTSTIITAFALMLVFLLAEVHISQAITCNPTQLSPCLAAISSSGPPSSLCCSRLQSQKPCYCTYLKNPNLSKYVNTPGGKKVASYCKVSYPRC